MTVSYKSRKVHIPVSLDSRLQGLRELLIKGDETVTVGVAGAVALEPDGSVSTVILWVERGGPPVEPPSKPSG